MVWILFLQTTTSKTELRLKYYDLTTTVTTDAVQLIVKKRSILHFFEHSPRDRSSLVVFEHFSIQHSIK